ncbi:MAG: YdiU family protein [Planctomycetes bacterium]|nr:YdiU family protein [Planctomycetota bacterium]
MTLRKPYTINSMLTKTLNDLSQYADYSLVNNLVCDPNATIDGDDHAPRQVFNGHYVPVKPEPIDTPIYITHSSIFFEELGLCDSLAQSEDFIRLFSGDTSQVPEQMRNIGWSCGYALSIYGTEYYDQCPFRTGNGYGDGRAISIFEGVLNNQRWEMQLKGGGRSPYCRGADGRAVLRSSVREFLAQEHMHALHIPTSRSLCLYTSRTESVHRPWFHDGSHSKAPEVMINEPVAISTRVAPSFIRVGQVELFARRARKNEHPNAKEELKLLILHLIDREYANVIDDGLPFHKKVITLAREFQSRLTSLVAHWIRVGYCQGNFNNDNCAAGGFTLDYGPFGFIDNYETEYQPWTNGGTHFSFMNQPHAAEKNYTMFCMALEQLLGDHPQELQELSDVMAVFKNTMRKELENMWASKLGLHTFNHTIFEDMIKLMEKESIDYTIFFRELSHIPHDITPLTKSFYRELDDTTMASLQKWYDTWKSLIHSGNPTEINATTPQSQERLSKLMKGVNPKYTLREWLLVPAYQNANRGDYSLLKELQDVMTNPYDEQSEEREKQFYRKKPSDLFHVAGISHVSCSS